MTEPHEVDQRAVDQLAAVLRHRERAIAEAATFAQEADRLARALPNGNWLATDRTSVVFVEDGRAELQTLSRPAR